MFHDIWKIRVWISPILEGCLILRHFWTGSIWDLRGMELATNIEYLIKQKHHLGILQLSSSNIPLFPIFMLWFGIASRFESKFKPFLFPSLRTGTITTTAKSVHLFHCCSRPCNSQSGRLYLQSVASSLAVWITLSRAKLSAKHPLQKRPSANWFREAGARVPHLHVRQAIIHPAKTQL